MPKSERNIISAQMEDILNAMPDGVFISDVDGTTPVSYTHLTLPTKRIV